MDQKNFEYEHNLRSVKYAIIFLDNTESNPLVFISTK